VAMGAVSAAKAAGVHASIALIIGAAACGGAGEGGPTRPPAAPTAGSSAPLGGAPLPASSSAVSSANGLPATGTATTAPVELKSPVPTTMTGDLEAIGLNAKNLPPIEKLEPKMLRAVMKLMARSLGAKCGDCHQEGDFAATTRRKKIAARMWDDFAAKLAMADGSALFCDSCHQGRIQQLDRHDKKALARWMDDNFVAKLARKDGKSHECETCHVDMEMHILSKWAP
jgi:hypothetical protein